MEKKRLYIWERKREKREEWKTKKEKVLQIRPNKLQEIRELVYIRRKGGK